MDIVPAEFQIPLVVLVGLIGFLAVIGLSGISSKSLEATSKTVSFSSPMKGSSKKSSTPIQKKEGSVMTPDGRRSARIARQARRKED